MPCGLIPNEDYNRLLQYRQCVPLKWSVEEFIQTFSKDSRKFCRITNANEALSRPAARQQKLNQISNIPKLVEVTSGFARESVLFSKMQTIPHIHHETFLRRIAYTTFQSNDNKCSYCDVKVGLIYLCPGGPER